MIRIAENWGEGQWHHDADAPAAVRIFLVTGATSDAEAARSVPQKGQEHPRDPDFVARDPLAVPLAVARTHAVGVLYAPPEVRVALEVDYHPARPGWHVTRPNP